MRSLTFDPRAKGMLFLISCLYCMNVKDGLPILAFGTYIAVLLCISGHFRDTVVLYAVLCVGLLIDMSAAYMQPGILSTILAITGVFICLTLPIVMSFILVFATTKTSEFLAAFQKIKTPSQITIPFAVMFRFIPTVNDEWRGIRQAMAFRGIGMSLLKIVVHPIVTAERILVPLLSSCVNIMDELVAASLVRGLDSEKERNCYLTIKMKFYDYIVVLINVGFIAVMLFV